MKRLIRERELEDIKKDCLHTVVRLYRDKWSDSQLVFDATSRMLASRSMLTGSFLGGQYLDDRMPWLILPDGDRGVRQPKSVLVVHNWGIGFVVGYTVKLFGWTHTDLSSEPFHDYAFDPFVLDVFYDWLKRPGAMERVNIKFMVSLAVLFLASHIYRDMNYMFSELTSGKFLLQDRYAKRESFIPDNSLLELARKDIDALAKALDVRPSRRLGGHSFSELACDTSVDMTFVVGGLILVAFLVTVLLST